MLLFMCNFRDGKYRITVNLLRKYLGDFLIASYLNAIRECGYDAAYVKEIEVMLAFYILHSIAATSIRLSILL